MRIEKTVWMALAGAAVLINLAAAQDRISVPFRDPARPGTLVVNVSRGGLTVKGYNGKEIQIEATAINDPRNNNPSPRGRGREVPPGMHRIDAAFGQLDVVEDNNVVTVQAGRTRAEDLTIQVPQNTALKLRVMSGGKLAVEGVAGEIDVNNMNGDVAIRGASGAVLAHSNNGKVEVGFTQFPADKPVSVTTMNGDIDLSLPSDAKAKLMMKTENGDIVTDFDIRIDPTANAPIVTDERAKNGRYRVTRGRTLTGTINGGGREVQITSYNGRLTIQKNK